MLQYIGTGFIPGVPARDLDDDEVRQYGGAQALISSGLYIKVENKAVNPPRETKAIVSDKKEN